MEKDKSFLGTQPVGKLLFKLSLPTVIAQIVNMLYNIVDRIYIGHMPGDGSLALTGVGVCLPIIMIISAFAAFVSAGGAPRASISMGKGDNGSAEKILGGCFFMQIIISAVLTALLLIFDRDLLLAFTAHALRIYCAVLCLFGIQMSCQMAFVSIGSALCSISVAVVRKFVLLLPLIYIMPAFVADKTMGVYMAEPVADVIAITFTSILFTIQFGKAMKKLEAQKKGEAK